MSKENSLNYTLVPVGDSRSERRASVLALFEAVHGRASTPEELADLDRAMDKDFPAETDERSAADSAELPRTDEDL